MSDRTHRSIGEVLHLLEDEFPEVTISKIRFLESQGLLNPERTPSGYRMFFNEDIGRLKWILVQQRDNFLPLRVIKKRLDSNEWSPEEFAISDVPAQADTFARNVEATEAGAASAVGEASPASVDDVASRLQAAAPAVADAVPEPVDVVPVAAVAAAEANPAPQIVQSTPVAPVEPPPRVGDGAAAGACRRGSTADPGRGTIRSHRPSRADHRACASCGTNRTACG